METASRTCRSCAAPSKTKVPKHPPVPVFLRNIATVSLGAFLFILGVLTAPHFPTRTSLLAPPPARAPPFRAAPAADAMQLENATRRTSPGNDTCVIVGCHTPRTPGAADYWDYYSRSHYAFAFYAFDAVTHNGQPANSKWCDVPAVRDELRLRRSSRVIFADVDTKVDVRAWCELPDHEAAPLIVNSYRRPPATRKIEGYRVEGSQVQTNAFRVTAGDAGLRAIKRWEDNFNRGRLDDQGALHQFEKGLCGIPGWVGCSNNPRQQGCHCYGNGHAWGGKRTCIKMLFNGTKPGCEQ